MADIIYTKVDEAPELASASFLPIIQKFAAAAGVSVDTMDISLAGRILATFPRRRLPNFNNKVLTFRIILTRQRPVRRKTFKRAMMV